MNRLFHLSEYQWRDSQLPNNSYKRVHKKKNKEKRRFSADGHIRKPINYCDFLTAEILATEWNNWSEPLQTRKDNKPVLRC